MPIKNYRTRVDSSKTCGEISGILASKGARRIQMEYDDEQRPVALSFTYPVYGFPVFFQLPCNIEGVHKCLMKSPGEKSIEHAHNVAWRIVKNWVEAQVAIVDAGAAQMVEVFLPYAVQQDGKTMFALFNETYAQKQLAAGDSVSE